MDDQPTTHCPNCGSEHASSYYWMCGTRRFNDPSLYREHDFGTPCYAIKTLRVELLRANADLANSFDVRDDLRDEVEDFKRVCDTAASKLHDAREEAAEKHTRWMEMRARAERAEGEADMANERTAGAVSDFNEALDVARELVNALEAAMPMIHERTSMQIWRPIQDAVIKAKALYQ